MARLSRKHPRFRSKLQMAEDVSCALASRLSYGGKFSVLHEVCWTWTEFQGKVRGCPYWTELALMQRRADPHSKVIHEHIVPKQIVIQILFDLEQPQTDLVYSLLEQFLIGVVVHPLEDQILNVEFPCSMPSEFFDSNSPSFHDPWLRYKRIPSIKVHQVSNAEKLGTVEDIYEAVAQLESGQQLTVGEAAATVRNKLIEHSRRRHAMTSTER
jgi:uncharacterized protein YlzI (FlbEa/FlbD family)